MSARDPHSCEAGVEALLAFALANAREAIKYDGLDKTRSGRHRSEKARLKRAIGQLEKYSAPLIEAASHAEKTLHLSIFHPLVNVLLGMHDAAMIGNVTKSAESFVYKKRQARAGSARGAELAKEAAETWRPEAIRLIREMRKVNPSASKAACARYVREKWGLAECLRPKSDRTIIRLLDEKKVMKPSNRTLAG